MTEARHLSEQDAAADPDVAGSSDRYVFNISISKATYGVLAIRVSDKDAFEPVVPFVINLASVLATVLEERRHRAELEQQRRDLERYQAELESRVTERTRKLAESERRYRLLADNATDMISTHDDRGSYTYVSPVCRSLLGYEPTDLLGHDAFELIHPEDHEDCRKSHERVVKEGNPHTASYRIRQKSGKYIWFETRSRLIRNPTTGEIGEIIAISRDISEKHLTEERLAHAQRLNAVGQLTGGIAHDFNNLLQVIAGSLELARHETRFDARVQKFLEDAFRAVMKGGNLTQKLLAFSRKQTLRPQIVAPRELIEGMRHLLSRTLGEDIEIETRCSEGDAKIRVDTHGFENALLNLALNARAAMPKGGRLTITSGVELFEEGIPVDAEVLPAGPYVEIAVSDTGCGMSKEILDRAFEPFFTTKGVGEGSGLGLSMVYGFARQSGGNAMIESTPGKETTVRILLPVANETSERPIAVEPARNAEKYGVKVLLVEDDPDVRTTTAMLLRSLGCDVREAETAEPALKILEEDGSIDLLLTDVILPGKQNGIGLAQDAVHLRPDLRVILVSGYPEAALQKAGLDDAGFALLGKPFSENALADALRSATIRNGQISEKPNEQ